jgi:hypothetical protein
LDKSPIQLEITLLRFPDLIDPFLTIRPAILGPQWFGC